MSEEDVILPLDVINEAIERGRYEIKVRKWSEYKENR